MTYKTQLSPGGFVRSTSGRWFRIVDWVPVEDELVIGLARVGELSE
jgi:hypothetical protein